ncbi:MAG: MerR family transcriptional regulator [Deltaproteobacteria bacterium]|nr:MAG: MerR family transcriptional regulator [Deltaproteobacteria bacterium]
MEKIPDKIYFKIGEVSKIVGVKPYVIRFWESEFNLRREKTKSSHRIYRRRDIETLITIKDLLYNQKFTIEGAKKKLKELKKEEKQKQLSLSLEEVRYRKILRDVKGELAKIKEMLDNI